MGRPKKEKEINEKVPKAGTEFMMTEDHAKEMQACMDPTNGIFHFQENYYYILSLDEGVVKIPLHVIQKQQIRRMISPRCRFNIILASRQVGKTTMMALVALWYMLFTPNFKILLLANKEATAIEIMKRIRMAYELCPAWLKPGVVDYNKTQMQLGNGSEISISTTTSDAGRSKAINLLLLDEFAFVENSEDFYTSVFPIISSSKKSRIIISSTPNGTENMFYQLVKEAEEGKGLYSLFKIHWSEIPGRTQLWADNMKKGMPSEEQYLQEFECVAINTSVNIENKGNITIGELYDYI